MKTTFKKTLLIETNFNKQLKNKNYEELCCLILDCWDSCLGLILSEPEFLYFYLSYSTQTSFLVKNLYKKEDLSTLVSYMYYCNPSCVNEFMTNPLTPSSVII